jgi:hypothetical protein
MSLMFEHVLIQAAEDAGFLWLARDRAVCAANFLLLDLVRLDERVESLIDALRIVGEDGWTQVFAQLQSEHAGAAFTAVALAVTRFGWEQLVNVIEVAAANDVVAAARAMISALAWVDRAAAMPVIGQLMSGGNSADRSLAVAAWGARRAVRRTFKRS